MGIPIGRLLKPVFGVLIVIAGTLPSAWAAGDLPTKFTNRGSVANTRHNLSQRVAGLNSQAMDPYRNDYAEVCVYCHTPHGANSDVRLPLWNRTIKATTYTTYSQLGTSTLTQTVVQPGANSLSCLSCHDGQVGVDSIINMPGSGGYNKAQATGQNDGFLNAWNNASGNNATDSHMGLNAQDGCLVCHAPGQPAGRTATDFTVFAIGTDLRNDHPVGVRFPTSGSLAATDFNPPTGVRADVSWFESDSNSRPDSKEVRLYNYGDGPMVECASCHDPHGVPTGGTGSPFNPTFLRIANSGSALCLTCHIK